MEQRLLPLLPEFIAVRIGLPNAEGCRMWQGRTDQGYPSFTTKDEEFSWDGRSVRVSPARIVYEVMVGPLPQNRWVSHLCHDLALQNGTCERGMCRHRACLEPSHMYLGIPAKRRALSRDR
jgi:hypothetical protein